MGRYRDRMRVLVAAGVVGMVLLAGCAKSATPATGGGGGGGATIGTTSIQGVGTVLVAPDGVTLYHLTTESGGSIQCTGSCEGVWYAVTPAGASSPSGGGRGYGGGGY